MVFQISSKKCLICRKLSDLMTNQTAVFIAWKTECATAICHVLFGKNIDYVVSYLLKANYCSSCEQLVRDVSYLWKQMQSFQNRISDLSIKMCTLLNLNYQMIEEKSQPELTQERISFLLDTTVPMKIPDYSYEEMVEIIYLVISSSLKSDLKVHTDSSFSNNLEEHTDSMPAYDSPPELFENVNKIKEECSSLEQQAIDDQLFNEDMVNNKPKIKSEQSYSDDCNESVESTSDFVNQEDVPLNKYVEDDANSSNDYEVKAKKRKRVRVRLNNKKKRYLWRLLSCDEEGCDSQFTCEANKQLHIRKMHKGESKPYNCQQCEGKFTSVSHLRRHENRVHEEGRVTKTHNCKICGTKYIELNDLTSHYSTSHQEPNPFLCAFCPELFQNNLDLTKHTKQSHHQPNVCKVCDSVFMTPSLLSSHEIKRHIGKAEWPQCSVCGQKCECRASLKVHMKKHEQLPLFKCEVCQLEFKSSSKLQSHSDLHIQGVFTCKVCGTILHNLYDMKVHESKHEPSQTVQSESEESNQSVVKKKPGRRSKLKVRPIKYNVECKFCGKGYFKEEDLNEHYAVAHVGPNPFTCAFCPQICSNSVDLFRHVKTVHPDPNSFIGKQKCNSCDRYFANSQSLSVHKRCHLDPSLLLKCHLCSAVFKQRQTLNAHLETHSGERKYVCDKCGKAYRSSQYLNIHSRIHDETQRKFACKICGKKFFTQAYCKNHERCHTNMKEFVCHVCGKGFNHDVNMREHLKIVHAGAPTRPRTKLKLKSAETYPKLP